MIFEMISLGILIPFFDNLFSENPKNLITYIFSHLKINSNFVIEYSLFLLILIFFLKSFFLTVVIYFKHKIILNFTRNLTSRILNKILILKNYITLKDDISEHQRLILVDVSMASNAVYQLINILSEITIILGIVIVIIFYEPAILLFAVLFSIITYLIYFKYLKNRMHHWGELRKKFDTTRRTQLSDLINSNIFSKLLNLKNQSINHFNFSNYETLKFYQLREMWNEIPRNLLEFLAVIIVVLSFFYYLANKSSIIAIIPFLSLLSVAFFKIIMSINRIIISFNQITFAQSSIENINNTLLSKDIIRISKLKKKLPFEKLQIINMKYSYNQNNYLFENFNLTIKKNDFFGFKGPSGSGKTTLIYLILGLLKPLKGKIIVNNKKTIQLNTFNIGFVSQNSYLINDSLSKNIAYGVKKENIDHIKINNLIKLTNLNEMILPIFNPDNFIINEKGANISVGQAQRISIARCLYFDPDIIILDEPTSALDKDNENKIISILKKLKGKKTILIISHSSKVLKYCNKIIQL